VPGPRPGLWARGPQCEEKRGMKKMVGVLTGLFGRSVEPGKYKEKQGRTQTLRNPILQVKAGTNRQAREGGFGGRLVVGFNPRR